MKKSTVFISCGQDNDREKSFGNRMVEYFQNKGFDTYFAEHIHCSKPLLQSILQALKESEYFVAWNPYRDKGGSCGSLFVQQEIAVAASLELPIIYFFDKGVNKTSGMSGALHLNGIEVNNISSLEQELNKLTKGWDNTSKNQLYLHFGNEHKNIAVVNHPQQPLSNWYHIIVENGCSYKQAKNCRAYAQKILKNNSQDLTSKYKQELIWAGAGVGSISITAKTKRDVDAIWTLQGSKKWTLQSIQTSTVYAYPVLDDGKYKIIYVVVSDSFPDASIEVEVDLKNDVASVLSQKQL